MLPVEVYEKIRAQSLCACVRVCTIVDKLPETLPSLVRFFFQSWIRSSMMFVSYDSSLKLIDRSGKGYVHTIISKVLNVRAHYSSVDEGLLEVFFHSYLDCCGVVGAGSDHPSIPHTIRLHAPACMHA